MRSQVNQAVILAGGQGTRMGSTASLIPKPLLRVGERSLLERIIESYYHANVRNILVLGGFEVQKVIDHISSPLFWSIGVAVSDGRTELLSNTRYPNLTVHVLDTGEQTDTGGRLLRSEVFLRDRFYLTYGDGLTDLDVRRVAEQHDEHENDATITVVRGTQRYGIVELHGNQVTTFREKDKSDGDLINAGYMVIEKESLSGFDGDHLSLEGDILSSMAKRNRLGFFLHDGFWMAADTPKELKLMNDLVNKAGTSREVV